MTSGSTGPSSKLANSSGVYSFVVSTVTKMDTTRTAAPIMNDKIKFVGFVSNVPIFLSKIDIYVNSSAWEGSPTAVWEALASGLPLVTTDVGSTDYYVGKMKAGLVSDVRNYKDIANKVLKLIKNKNLRKKYGLKAKFVANTYLNVRRCAKLHKLHYKNLLEEI